MGIVLPIISNPKRVNVPEDVSIAGAGLFNHVEDLALAANVWSSSASNLIEVNTEVKTFEKGAS